MFKKTGDNAFVFVTRPKVVMLRSTEEFWRLVPATEELIIMDGAGMPIEYSDGQKSWYPGTDNSLFLVEKKAAQTSEKDNK